MIVRLYELDKALAPQGLDFFQHVGSELLGVAGHEMSLDPGRASPAEIAERASALGHVLFFQVSLKLLNPSKVFVARYADRSHMSAHSAFSVALGEALDSEMTFGSEGLNVVVRIGSDCVVGQKIGL